jgi:hypothetical protein
MEPIVAQAKALIEELMKAERRTLFYEGADSRRDDDYRKASHAYGDAINVLDDWLSEFLIPAVRAEQDAEAEESVW